MCLVLFALFFHLFIYFLITTSSAVSAIVRQRRSGQWKFLNFIYWMTAEINWYVSILWIKINDTCTSKHEKVLFNSFPLFTSYITHIVSDCHFFFFFNCIHGSHFIALMWKILCNVIKYNNNIQWNDERPVKSCIPVYKIEKVH